MASEGPMGLGRAFFVAGARAVVATHWPVRDDDAAAFSDRFYDALSRGQTVAGAVASAQRDLRRRGAPAAVWAAFTVLGDGGWAPIAAVDRQLGWLAALALAAVAIGGVFAVIVRRR